MSNYTLKSIKEIQSQIGVLNDDSFGLSFLFYSICQGNTMDYKGTSASVVKRLTGAKLFDLVPMASYKKGENDKKAVFQYRKTGSNKMRDLLDAKGLTSIADLLEIDFEGASALPKEYFDTFCDKVEAYFKSIEASKKSAKETEKEQADQAFANYTAKPSKANVKREEYDDMLKALDKKRSALKLLKEAGDVDIVALLEEVIANEEAELSGGQAEPMTSGNGDDQNGIQIVNTNELD